ncbi:MAG: SDR family NAD(P)-dependent oxidoreductase [Candidatus Schekmanbacteria bacterium]|nr:SDR family NAD(P)-dependent oxidoreductase [Candidatus Schekmanbacteria bacterium]
MKPAIVICGHGPGIADAVARRFGREGHPVAIVARSAERLSKAAEELSRAGIKAQAFPCDLGDPEALPALMSAVRSAMGPIGILHWNAYVMSAGDLTTAPVAELRSVLDVTVHGLVAAVQAALPDLAASTGAVLVTGGGFALYDANIDAMAVQWRTMGVAIGKAAQRKTVGLLHQRLASEGVYVGEVVVLGAVKGTAFDGGQATIDASTVADRFWEICQNRSEVSVSVA